MVYIFSISHRKVQDSLHAGNQRLQAILPCRKTSYTAISETEKKTFSSFLSFFSLFENRISPIRSRTPGRRLEAASLFLFMDFAESAFDSALS